MQPKEINTQAIYEGVKSLLRQQKKPDTPYGVAKFLGASRGCGYTWRDNTAVMDDTHAIRALTALGWDRELGLASLAAERAARSHNDESAAIWHRIALRLATAATVCSFAVFYYVEMTKPVL